MFTDEQKKLLQADLLRSNVKTRDQSGMKLSYIEGWHAIAEANRIFGFDGWSSETVETKCVHEGPRKVAQGDGFGVAYVCRVRITLGGVSGVVREGTGTGHGTSRSLGDAHESAIKEAETDARKRALMTFGNQFGLALYDKSQENVEDDTRPASKPSAPASDPKQIRKTPRQAQQEIEAIQGAAALQVWEDQHGDWLARLAPVMPGPHKALVETLKAKHEALNA